MPSPTSVRQRRLYDRAAMNMMGGLDLFVF